MKLAFLLEYTKTRTLYYIPFKTKHLLMRLLSALPFLGLVCSCADSPNLFSSKGNKVGQLWSHCKSENYNTLSKLINPSTYTCWTLNLELLHARLLENEMTLEIPIGKSIELFELVDANTLSSGLAKKNS